MMKKSISVMALLLGTLTTASAQQQFMRINRSYVVNLKHIRKIDRNDCVYILDEIIHVTDAYKEAFEQFLKIR